MTLLVAGVVLLVVLLSTAVVVHRRRGHATAVLVACDPESALLGSAVALRRLGARITRYDSEDGTLEATVPAAGRVRLRAAPNGGDATLVHLEGDHSTRRVVRRFRDALSV